MGSVAGRTASMPRRTAISTADLFSEGAARTVWRRSRGSGRLRGEAWQGRAWRGAAGQGRAGPGSVRPGKAGQGAAWHGWARGVRGPTSLQRRARAMSDAPLTAAMPPATGDRALPAAPSERNVRRAIRMARRVPRTPFIPIKPAPAQLAYLLIEEREALFTGAGGNGKTTALMLAMLVDVDRPGYRALMVQRTMAGPVTLAERIREWLEP